MKDVARLLRVAPSTVSRALSGKGDVSPEMRRRVLEASKVLGYEPDPLAQSLRRGRTRTVGFIVRDITNPLFAEIVKGAEQRLRARGYCALLMNSLGDENLDAAHIELLTKRRVDGLILSLTSESYPETIRALGRLKIPVVLLDREVEQVEYSAVLCDHLSGVREAVSDLLRRGHRRIGMIGGPGDIRASRERTLGYRKAFSDRGFDPPSELIRHGSYARETGYVFSLQLLDDPAAATALILAGIQIGVGALEAVSQLKMRVPQDVAIVVCDQVELMTVLHPTISTVSRDALYMGAAAADLLMERLGDSALPPRVEVLPTRYVARESTAGSLLRAPSRPAKVRGNRVVASQFS